MLSLLGLLLLASPSAEARMYLAPVKVAEGVDAGSRIAVEEALLGAARRRHGGVVGSLDIQTLLDAEAATQAAGCDSDGCDAELADALGAPELLSAQLVRLGDTWILSLSRLRRADMAVVARHQVTRSGGSASVILSAVDELCDVVIAPLPAPMLAIGGAVTAGVGVAIVGGGVAMMLYGVERFDVGKKALDDGDLQTAFEIRRDFEWLTPGGGAVIALGSAVVVGGVALIVIDAVTE